MCPVFGERTPGEKDILRLGFTPNSGAMKKTAVLIGTAVFFLNA